MSYYAGRVVRIDKREEEVQTTYMKRIDMHKNDAVTFSGPEIEDHIITKLPEPTTVDDTTCTADKLSFEFDHALYETMLFYLEGIRQAGLQTLTFPVTKPCCCLL